MFWFYALAAQGLVIASLITPAQAAVPTPVGPSWSLIFDEEFNLPAGTATPADFTHLNPVWTSSSGTGLRGGPYCWRQHGITLFNHEIDLAAKSTCWVAGATQTGEGARIATGPQASGATFNCSPTGQVSINGVTQAGFCFSPTDICPHTPPSEIYEEVLYDVPCSGANLLDHAAFWNVGNGPWPSTNEFDIIQPDTATQVAGEVFFSSPPSPQIATPVAACGWHVFGAHWIGGATPTFQFLVDGNDAGTVTQNITTAPQMMLLELAWDGTPATITAPATAKAIYVHVYGNQVSYPPVTPQANYSGPGDTAGKTLGAP